MPRVLVLSNAPMPAAAHGTPGSGVRQYEMARALARAGLDVALLTPRAGDPIDGVDVRELQGSATTLPAGFDAYVLPIGHFGAGAQRPATGLVVVDAYDQSLFSYALRDADTPEGRIAFEARIHEVAAALIEADVVLNAGRAARHALLGMLSLLGRIAPGHADPGDDLLDVPLGAPPPLAPCVPIATDPPLPAGAETVLWSSGTYVFFDAERALAAFERVAERRPNAHFLVAGGVAPGVVAADRAAYERFVARAKSSPAASRIRFVEWTPYPSRGAIYAAARGAVVLTNPGPEDELSWRNRVIDAVGAGLPTVLDGESDLTRIVADAGAGVAVERSVEAASSAIDSLLSNDAQRSTCSVAARALAAGRLSWDACAAPLVARIRRAPRASGGLAPAPIDAVRLRRRRWGTAMHRLEVSLRLRGPAGFVAHNLRRVAGRGPVK